MSEVPFTDAVIFWLVAGVCDHQAHLAVRRDRRTFVLLLTSCSLSAIIIFNCSASSPLPRRLLCALAECHRKWRSHRKLKRSENLQSFRETLPFILAQSANCRFLPRTEPRWRKRLRMCVVHILRNVCVCGKMSRGIIACCFSSSPRGAACFCERIKQVLLALIDWKIWAANLWHSQGCTWWVF